MNNSASSLAFTKAEIRHLLYLIEVNERDGWYHSPREEYWKRSDRIKKHLMEKEVT
jgi:hypothetical protein